MAEYSCLKHLLCRYVKALTRDISHIILSIKRTKSINGPKYAMLVYNTRTVFHFDGSNKKYPDNVFSQQQKSMSSMNL